MENNKTSVVATVKATVKNRIVRGIKKLYGNKFTLCVVSAFVINLFIELVWRRSFASLAEHIVYNPHMFLYGASIIALTLCLSMFAKKRLFAYIFISAVWIGFGIANATFLSYRSTPVVAIDFMIMRASIGVFTIYMSVFVILLIVLGVVAAIALFVFLHRKCKKESVVYICSLLQILGVGTFVATLSTMYYFTGAVPSEMRLPEIHEKCGYAYCLANSLFDYGVDRPEVYTEEYMDNIRDVIDGVEPTVPEEKPNIIFLQLESFMDMNRLEEVELSSEPTPYFNQLKEDYPSGKLTVNALGASTANVEFEVITGTYIKDYGFDEYPYKTFLKETGIETVAYDLKELGYSTTATHNHDGAFYGRNTAYANLGFDRFIPRECMTGLEYTPMGWAKDKVLVDVIGDTLAQTEERDFVLAVSVQCHSKYPKYRIEDMEYTVTASGVDDEEYANMLSYYATCAKEEDEFIRSLLESLSALDEKTVVVLYGDHLPTFVKDSIQLKDGANSTDDTEKYNSEYVIWANYDMDAEDKDLTACELASTALAYAGIRTGDVLRLYQADIDDELMDEYRHAITYDVIEGNNYLNGGVNKYTTVDMVLGLTPIRIDDYELREETLYVYGSGFTEDAKIYINNALYATSFVNDGVLKVNEQVTVENGDSLVASIVTFDFVRLSSSNAFVIDGLPGKVTASKGIHGIHAAVLWCIIIAISSVVLSCAFLVYRKTRKNKQNRQ